MHPLALSGSHRLIAGIAMGVIFGFLLVRSKLAWRKTFADLFRLKGNNPINAFLVSVAIGAPLFYLTTRLGLTEINVRPVYFWGAVSGGLICGAGIVNCKQIPATAVATLASGRIHSVWILMGMLIAMPVIKLMSDFLDRTVYSWGAPFAFHQRLDGYFQAGTITVWICVISVCLSLFFCFAPGGGNGSEGKKK